MPSPMRTISIKLPEHLNELLSALARQRRSSRSAVIREAVVAYATGPHRSVTAAAGDLAGSLDGPADLSTDPRHMAGYGK